VLGFIVLSKNPFPRFVFPNKDFYVDAIGGLADPLSKLGVVCPKSEPAIGD